MLGRIVTVVIAGAAGWLAGSFFPAPQALIAQVTPQLVEARVKALSDQAVTAAEKAGQVITVEHLAAGDMASDMAAEAEGAAPSAMPAAGGHMGFDGALAVCPGMTISNSPKTDAKRQLVGYSPFVDVQGVKLAVDPTPGACLSSGFGPRGSRQHKGVDFHEDIGGPVLAAADGTLIEMKYRDDYGNMLLIDHGKGVYTRYAHLAGFDKSLRVGGRVKAGDILGLMGNTASYPIPIHLHYEILTGDYANPKASFGLTPVSPFAYPASKS